MKKHSTRKDILSITKTLDYGDIFFDKTFDNSFHERLESIQYNTALAIPSPIRGTWKENVIKNSALNPCSKEDDTGNFFSFSK